LCYRITFSAKDEGNPAWNAVDKELKGSCIFLGTSFFLFVQGIYATYVLLAMAEDIFNYISDSNEGFKVHFPMHLE
jgi:hypothetical protein